MKRSTLVIAQFVMFMLCASSNLVRAQIYQAAPAVPQNEEAAVVDSSTEVLNEIMSVSAQGIPRALLRDAQGIAIVPGMLKGGFVVGVRHGRGIILLRDDAGNWRPPSFISITGGSIGWQAGIQATDVILVFKTKNSIKGILNGKFTIGGDVSAAAGPVGREASASTDATLKAEIYSYSRSRGLFAGAALDGSVLSLDNSAIAAYYRGTGILQPDAPPGQPPMLPPSAARLLETVAAYAKVEPTPGPLVDVTPGPVAPTASMPAGVAPGPVYLPSAATPNSQLPADIQAVRSQLGNSSQRLGAMLDKSWQQYLALPAEVYGGNRLPDASAMTTALNRFNTVAADAKYRNLAQRPEYQETFGLLKAYCDLQAASTPALALPPPPR